MKPRAAQVSVNPSGLAVVTGTDVQAALAQLDAAMSAAAIDERARDAVGAALVAGSGISISVNDPADTITIAATGVGTAGAVTWTLVVNEPGTSLANWTTIAGTWAVDAGGYLKQTDTAAGYKGLRYNSRVPVGAGLVMEADCAWSGAAATLRVLLGPATNAVLTATTNPYGGLDKTSGVVFQRGDAAAFFAGASPASGVFQTIRVTVLGGYMTITQAGTLIGTYLIQPTGDVRYDYPMLVCYAGEARFKNIKVWRLDGPA